MYKGPLKGSNNQIHVPLMSTVFPLKCISKCVTPHLLIDELPWPVFQSINHYSFIVLLLNEREDFYW